MLPLSRYFRWALEEGTQTVMRKLILIALFSVCLHGCGESGDATAPVVDNLPPVVTPPVTPNSALDDELRALIATNNLSGDPSIGRDLPSIDEPLAVLGKQLFFTKGLGGEMDSACVTCHHPVLGGGDGLSLSVGVHALNPDLLGPGRETAAGVPNVPRNAPTTFNIGLWDSALFMDARVESLGKETGENGAASGISTPDSGHQTIDAGAGADLVIAQARFPVTSAEEMRGALLAGETNDVLRDHLAARLGNYGSAVGELPGNDWLGAFQLAFASGETAENLITFGNIVAALAAYERSQVFVDTPWRAYVRGDNDAININAKQGAVLFLTDVDQNGAGCVQCHSGDLFTDEQHHTIGAPQFGPGKGNPGNHDFARENVTGLLSDRFRFRTPSLLNIEVTGPYMHDGAYESLQEVMGHYSNPAGAVNNFFDDGGWCQLEQFANVADCLELYPDAMGNSNQVLAKINVERAANDPAALPNINLDNNERNELVAFLRTLTDPCVTDRVCLARWIPNEDEAADDMQLNAVDSDGIRY